MGFKYYWRRYLGWIPLQPCMNCERWYWGGFPLNGWQPSAQEYCSYRCWKEGESCE